MVFKNQAGRVVELSVFGKHADDLQCGQASYADGAEEVSDADIDFIFANQALEIHQLWIENCAGAAEAHRDFLEDR